MNRKAKGSAWEREIIKILEFEGCACTRAAGSMGVWDIIAFNGNSIMLIQAKCNGLGSRREREIMVAFKAPPNASKMLWRKNDREAAPVIYAPEKERWRPLEDATRAWQAGRREMKRRRK